MSCIITVASINLGNLGEWSSQERVERLIYSILHDLTMPDLIAVQEIGALQPHPKWHAPLPASLPLQICQSLNRYAPDGAYRYIELAPIPGQSGGDPLFNIRSGFFYRNTLTPKRLQPIAPNTPPFSGGINGRGERYSPSRLPLALLVEREGRSFWALNLHLKSMNATTNRASKVAKRQRHEQATLIQRFINEKCSPHPTLIMGDFNDTPGSNTLKILENRSTFTPIWDYGKRGTYTYRHRNRPLVLDYILYNAPFRLMEASVFHINSEQHPYHERRYSDHDPILARFSLP